MNKTEGGWVIAMNWEDLLFMHWPLPPETLRPLIPQGLTLDTFAGQAWIGVVPFTMTGVRPRWTPALPGLSVFPELNVRTYVKAGSESGVWFFSLDAASYWTVRGARKFFHLPYFDAEMSSVPIEEEIHYSSHRTHRKSRAAELKAEFSPTGPVREATEHSLDEFLTARYSLFSADAKGNLYQCRIHHKPWQLQSARADIHKNTMTEQLDLRLPDQPPLLHFAKRTEVVAAWPERILRHAD